ncbi:unnamed protein product [Caenorhabditis angaria]|uniref:Uncharacterized protein n=1 Tax=Caenorhabditis angaria TaxID=860376 RepID=A0A9P1N5G2_9PELO|nr:unnamed protein product [Caenorhabditis angaria]
MNTSCEDMLNVATYKPLSISLLILSTISTIAVPMLIFLIRKIIFNSLYHINTRVIIVAHCIILLGHLINRIFLHASDLYRFLIIYPDVESACDILLNSTNCFFYRMIFNYGIWFSGTTAPCIIVERFIATKTPISYHKNRITGIILVFVQFFGCIGLSFMTYYGYVFGQQKLYCMTAKPNRDLINTLPFVAIIILQIFSFINLYVLKKYNIHMKKMLERGKLTRRYQIEETLRSLKTLTLPIQTMFISQMLFTTNTFYFQRYYAAEISTELFFTLSESIVLLPEYTIIFVFTFVKIENRINIERITNLNERINVKTDAYFEQYKNHW